MDSTNEIISKEIQVDKNEEQIENKMIETKKIIDKDIPPIFNNNDFKPCSYIRVTQKGRNIRQKVELNKAILPLEQYIPIVVYTGGLISLIPKEPKIQAIGKVVIGQIRTTAVLITKSYDPEFSEGTIIWIENMEIARWKKNVCSDLLKGYDEKFDDYFIELKNERKKKH